MENKSERDKRRNKRLRVENDYNRVLNEYVQIKYADMSQEFSKFYDNLREKYPDKYFYKGSKKFRAWVRKEISAYDGETATPDVSGAVVSEADVSEAVVSEAAVSEADVSEAAVSEAAVSEAAVSEAAAAPVESGAVDLGGIVANTIGEVVVDRPTPIENVIANGLPEELEELDALIGGIIAGIEGQCDEGISLSPRHELEVDPLYYDAEVEGLDDIEFDIPSTPLEAELEIELGRFF